MIRPFAQAPAKRPLLSVFGVAWLTLLLSIGAAAQTAGEPENAGGHNSAEAETPSVLDLKRQQSALRKESQAVFAKAKAEARPFTDAEKRQLRALTLEDTRLTALITSVSPRPAPDETLTLRSQHAQEIGRALGLIGVMKVMSNTAQAAALDVLESTSSPRADVWRAAVQERLGPDNLSVYGGAQAKLEDLEAVRSWLDTPTGRKISEAVQGWDGRMPGEPEPLEIEPTRMTRYSAIAASASWGQFLYSAQAFFIQLPRVVDDYGMTTREMAKMWSEGISYSRRAFEPVLARTVMPHVFGEVDDATLDSYIEFLRTTQAQRAFAQLSRTSSRLSYSLLEATLQVLQEHALKSAGAD